MHQAYKTALNECGSEAGRTEIGQETATSVLTKPGLLMEAFSHGGENANVHEGGE